MAKFISKTFTREVTDQETGEMILVDTVKEIGVKIEVDEFYQTYTKFVGIIYGLSKASDIKFLLKLCELAEYNTGVVRLTASLREEIAKETGINVTNISKHISTLTTLGVIAGSKGDYTINPTVFWKGDRKTRAKMLQEGGLQLNFKFYGK